MFENFEEPTEFDYELLKIMWRYATSDQRKDLELLFKNCFSEWDLTAFKELTKTIIFIRSV